jgi:TIR domain
MSGVFLSYRRSDTANDAERIHARLAERFGNDLVYIDVEDIPLGVNFVDHITAALRDASYVLVAIGPRWLLVTDEDGQQRLKNPDDPVRYEIRTALQNRRLVVPMLIGNARMPEMRSLPEDISKLVLHNGIAIRPDPDFEADVAALMDGLHLDRIKQGRVPTVFKVGLVARHLGYGGAIGWGMLGAVLGMLGDTGNRALTVLLTTGAGLLAGWMGGWLVGLFTGQLIKRKSPPLVTRQVRRMGYSWSFLVIGTVAIGVVVGLLIANQPVESASSTAEGFGEAIGEAIGQAIAAAFLALLTILAFTFLGLIVGSGLAAAYFARKLRLRSGEISRWRAIVIGMVWMIGGVLTGLGFIVAFAYALQVVETGF